MAKNGENVQGADKGFWTIAAMGWIYQEHHGWATAKATRLDRLA